MTHGFPPLQRTGAVLAVWVALNFVFPAQAQSLPAPPPASTPAPASTPFVPYVQREDVLEFIRSLAAAYALDQAWLVHALSQARYSEQAERLNTPALTPAWQRSWNDYRARNVNEERIRGGQHFMRTHRTVLRQAQQRWGVPAEIIAAIIGIETHYGRVKGNLRTLDVLATLSFDYTRRAALFREELVHYLLWCHEQGIDPTTPRGSFAAAMGLPQFMPSSLRLYAVDFDQDGRINLAQSVPDAVGSVAAFLSAQGWQADVPVLLKAQHDPRWLSLADQGIEPQRSWSQLSAQGVVLEDAHTLEPTAPVLLIELASAAPDAADAPVAQSSAPPSVWRVGTRNFAALLQYNRSYFYAASVTELAQALREHTAVVGSSQR